MGERVSYEVHIHRRENWYDDGAAITLQEWIATLENDPSLEINGSVVWKVEGGSVETPTAKWESADDADGYFHWYEGAIVVTRPSQQAIVKAFQIAKALGACVQGDDGEFYDHNGLPVDG